MSYHMFGGLDRDVCLHKWLPLSDSLAKREIETERRDCHTNAI